MYLILKSLLLLFILNNNLLIHYDFTIIVNRLYYIHKDLKGEINYTFTFCLSLIV